MWNNSVQRKESRINRIPSLRGHISLLLKTKIVMVLSILLVVKIRKTVVGIATTLGLRKMAHS